MWVVNMWVAGRMVNLSILALLPPAAEEPPPPVGKPPPVEEPAPTRAPRSPGQPPVTDLWFQTRLPEPSQMSLALKVAELNAKEDYIAKQQLDLKKMLANPDLEPAQEPGGASAGAASAAGAGPKAARKPCKKKGPKAPPASSARPVSNSNDGGDVASHPDCGPACQQTPGAASAGAASAAGAGPKASRKSCKKKGPAAPPASTGPVSNSKDGDVASHHPEAAALDGGDVACDADPEAAALLVPPSLEPYRAFLLNLPPEARPSMKAKGFHNYTVTKLGYKGTVTVRSDPKQYVHSI